MGRSGANVNPNIIRTFKQKALEKLLQTGSAKGIPSELLKRVRIRLDALDAAQSVDELNLPGYRLHELKGDRQGTWSIRVSGNWRLTFKFQDQNAYDVNLEDYH